jgi:hypothetical protein
MAASFGALGNNHVHTCVYRSLCLGDGLDLREDLDPSGMRRCDVGCGIGKGVIDRRDLLVERHLDQVVKAGE